MIIPPIRWGDILLRSTDERSVQISEREQYLLMMLLSWVQINPSIFLPDYDTDSEDINQFLGEAINNLIDETIPPAVNLMGTRYDLWAHNTKRGINDAGNSVVISPGFTGALFNYYAAQTTAALNDQTHQIVYLEAGEYIIRHVYRRTANSGKLSIYVWEQFGAGTIYTPINQHDMYGATAESQIVESSPFTIDNAGQYKIVWGIPAKNASSGGYQHNWTVTTISKTGNA